MAIQSLFDLFYLVSMRLGYCRLKIAGSIKIVPSKPSWSPMEPLMEHKVAEFERLAIFEPISKPTIT